MLLRVLVGYSFARQWDVLYANAREEGRHVSSTPEVERFYTSRAWAKCRASFLADRGGLCELCLKKGLIEPATQVHHKIHITLDNVNDPTITLNHDNLIALCDACHHEQHQKKRWRCDALGHVTL